MSKSLFGQYLEEFLSVEIIEESYGFATYSIQEQVCYIQDIFILKEYRKQNKASQLADLIVKEALLKGCNVLIGTIVSNAIHADTNIKVLQAYGLKFTHIENNILFFKKDI